MSPEELLEAEVLIYLRGLGFPTDRRPRGEGRIAPSRRRCRLAVVLRSLGQAEIKFQK